MNPGAHEVQMPCLSLCFSTIPVLMWLWGPELGFTWHRASGSHEPPPDALQEPFAPCSLGTTWFNKVNLRKHRGPSLAIQKLEDESSKGNTEVPTSFQTGLSFLPVLEKGPRGHVCHAALLPTANVSPINKEAAPSCPEIGGILFCPIMSIVKPFRNSSILCSHFPQDKSNYNQWCLLYWEEYGNHQNTPLLKYSKFTSLLLRWRWAAFKKLSPLCKSLLRYLNLYRWGGLL